MSRPRRPRARADALANKARTEVAETRKQADAHLAKHQQASTLTVLARRVLREQSNRWATLAAAGAAFWLVIAVATIYGLFASPDRVATSEGATARFAICGSGRRSRCVRNPRRAVRVCERPCLHGSGSVALRAHRRGPARHGGRTQPSLAYDISNTSPICTYPIGYPAPDAT